MMNAKELKQESIRHSLEFLKASVNKDTVVSGVVIHASRSGMQRVVRILVAVNGEVRDISAAIGMACDIPRNHQIGGVKVNGCGFCPIQHVVEHLSYTLFGKDVHLAYNRL